MAANLGGAVAIWHDIAPEGLAEFYAWHGEEHMPERVGIPGFLRGRRYVAIDADLEFFNLYETVSPDVVKGPDYKTRLDSPTPRTLSAVRHFRNVARSLCAVAARATASETGAAQGGIIATLRYDVAEGRDAAHLAAMRESVLPDLIRAPGVAACQLLQADLAASGYVNAEQRARGAANQIPPYCLIVEGWAEETAFMAMVRSRLDNAACAALGMAGQRALGFYRLQLTTVR
jgi:hypothetical protein